MIKFLRFCYMWHEQAVKAQMRLHICAVSSEHLLLYNNLEVMKPIDKIETAVPLYSCALVGSFGLCNLYFYLKGRTI